MMHQHRQLFNACGRVCIVVRSGLSILFLLLMLLLSFLSLLGCQDANAPHIVPMPTDTPACLTQVTPVPSPSPSPQQKMYNDEFFLYFSLLLHRNYQKAYSLLSTALRATELYPKFIKDSSYVLSTDDWKIYQIVTSQQEKGETKWNIGVELEVTRHNEDKTIWYDWNIHMRMEHGHPVIVQMGLYPTGVSC